MSRQNFLYKNVLNTSQNAVIGWCWWINFRICCLYHKPWAQNQCTTINVFFKINAYFPRVTGCIIHHYPDSKVHGANMGPTWVLSAPDGPHVGPMNLAIRVRVLMNTAEWIWGRNVLNTRTNKIPNQNCIYFKMIVPFPGTNGFNSLSTGWCGCYFICINFNHSCGIYILNIQENIILDFEC